MSAFPISPLSLDQTTRDTWGLFDPIAIAQLAPLAEDQCYRPKFHKCPDAAHEIFQPNQYQLYGLTVTPGSIIYGVYGMSGPAGVQERTTPTFMLQVTDQSLAHKWYEEPVSSLFLMNPLFPFFPGLFTDPYPVVGSGLFLVEMWENSGLGIPVRLQLVFGVLEVCPK